MVGFHADGTIQAITVTNHEETQGIGSNVVDSAEYLAQYQHTKAFLGVSSIAPDGALGVSSYPEHAVKRTAMERSLRRYLLADSSKFGEAGLLPYGQVSQCTCVFTDRDMPQAFLDLCREQGTEVRVI